MSKIIDPMHLVLVVIFALFASACSRGPDEKLLIQDLQSRLDQGFDEGLFTIRSFKRTGSAPFRNIEQETSGVFVYYDAELEFMRDYSLMSWKGLNLGTLAFVLGSTKSGIKGYHPKTNRKGDKLKVYGRLAYKRKDKEWLTVIDSTPPMTEKAPGPMAFEGSGPRSVLKSIRNLLQRHPHAARGTQDATIIKELQLSVTRIDLKFAQLQGQLIFSSGQAPGTYHDFGLAFSQFATDNGLPIHNYISEGSVENAMRVHNNLVTFALIQSDVAETIYKGWKEENLLANTDLRSMASLWPEAVQIVTLQSTGIETFLDLVGKRIAVGNPGSGSRFSAIRIAQAAGFNREKFPEIREFGLTESIAALEAAQVDAIIATEAIPSLAIQELTARRQDVRFLSLDSKLVARLSKKQFAYYPLTIPAKTYSGQEYPIRTLGLAAILITNQRMNNTAVEQILELILDGADDLYKKYYRAGFISKDTMRLGIAVPLHTGALKFYARRNPTAEIKASGKN
jgi:TRAP transporter TAXI family solute receptor